MTFVLIICLLVSVAANLYTLMSLWRMDIELDLRLDRLAVLAQVEEAE